MEPIHGTLEDYISSMPDNVITNILHRLSLQEAVRTGILSRNWRFKWTMLTQLKFNEDFFLLLAKTRDENIFGKVINSLVLRLNGPVTKCVIIFAFLDPEDVDRLILFLSRKGIKDLTLTDWTRPQVKLPTHLFSCLQLKHLKMVGCCFDPPTSFHGFPNLLSLELRVVQFGGSDLGEFLTRCPLLEILDLGYLSYSGNVKLVEIAKLENLKMLSMSLCHIETTANVSSCSVFELLGYLPKLQELGLDFEDYKLTEGGAKWKFPAAYPNIKALKLTRIDFRDGIVLSCALEMIRHFPNLQTLDITAAHHVVDPDLISIPISIPEVEYNMKELQSVMLTFSKGSANEVCLIKFFLACSPFLKKIVIQRNWCLEPIEQLFYAKMLLKLHRASPVAEIDFY